MKHHDRSPYREVPNTPPLRAREHAPICTWCTWSFQTNIGNGLVCLEPVNNPSKAWFNVCSYNGAYQDCCSGSGIPQTFCKRYRPSLWTWFLQKLKIRPFIELETVRRARER